MFYVIYNQSSGALLDVNEGTTESVLPDTAIKAFDGEIPDMTGSHWDTTTLDFIPRIIPTPRVITIYEYLNLFSAVERCAIKTEAKTNMPLQDYLDMLQVVQYIDLADVMTQAGLSFLVSLGLLTPARMSEILA
jgi:hypothetical protein